MKRSLLRNVYLSSHNLRLSTSTLFNPNPPIINTSLVSLTSSEVRFLSSDDNSSSVNRNAKPFPETDSTQSQKKDVTIAVEDVSDKELKRRIENYFEGDEEAIPSIFEAILRRKLAGKHDDEFMDEIRKHSPDKKDFDSDSDSDSEQF